MSLQLLVVDLTKNIPLTQRQAMFAPASNFKTSNKVKTNTKLTKQQRLSEFPVGLVVFYSLNQNSSNSQTHRELCFALIDAPMRSSIIAKISEEIRRNLPASDKARHQVIAYNRLANQRGSQSRSESPLWYPVRMVVQYFSPVIVTASSLKFTYPIKIIYCVAVMVLHVDCIG